MAKNKQFTHESWALLAAEMGALPYLKLAIELGADLNKPTPHPTRSSGGIGPLPTNTTPLFEAVVAGNADAVEMLLEAGADPRVSIINGYDRKEVSPKAVAVGEIARLIAAKSADPGAAEREAFAFGLSPGASRISLRDIVGEAREWIAKGTDPFKPEFGGRSLLSLLHTDAMSANPLLWQHDQSEQIKLLATELCGMARTQDELDAALEAAIALTLAPAADKAIKDGALAGMSRERLTALLEMATTKFPLELAETREELLLAGADPKPFVFGAWRRRRSDDVERIAKENPEGVAEATDSNGFGLLWHVLKYLAEHLNDQEEFAWVHALAKRLLSIPSTRVLTGNGLGLFGPPAASFAAILSDKDRFKNAKRATQASAIAEKILAKARSEAEEFGADCQNTKAPLPGDFNVLHLASMCANSDVAGMLSDKAAALGRSEFFQMAVSGAEATKSDEERRRGIWGNETTRSQYPFEIVLGSIPSPFGIDLAVEFAKHMGVNSKFEGKQGTVFTRICLRLDESLSGDFVGPLRRLFDLGADPDAMGPFDTRPLQELLERKMEQREQESYTSDNKSKFTRLQTEINEAFIEAAGKGKRKPDTPKKRATL